MTQTRRKKRKRNQNWMEKMDKGIHRKCNSQLQHCFTDKEAEDIRIVWLSGDSNCMHLLLQAKRIMSCYRLKL